MKILKETKEFLTDKGRVTLEEGDSIQVLKEEISKELEIKYIKDDHPTWTDEQIEEYWKEKTKEIDIFKMLILRPDNRKGK
jgi:hypothetical protein